MFAWIARLLRRNRIPPGSSGAAEVPAGPADPPGGGLPDAASGGAAIPAATAPGGGSARSVRKLDYALLISDSGSLEDLPMGERYLELARRHGGIVQATVSGLTLVLFEPDEEGLAATGRVEFARELERKTLARIRCLHGQALARQESRRTAKGEPAFTLLNFHVLVQHAAALDLGKVTEAGSYHAAQRTKPRRPAAPARPEPDA